MASISNPELVLALKMFKADPTPESQAALARAMTSAQFLAPVKVDSTIQERSREPDGSTILEQKQQVGYLLLNMKDGRRMLPAFTDMEAVHAWNPEPCQTMALRLPQYAALLRNASINAAGLILNPKTHDVSFPAQAILRMGQPPAPSVDMKKPYEIATPQQLPQAFINALQASCTATPAVKKAWLRTLTQGPVSNWLLVLELEPGTDAKQLFAPLVKPAAPHAGGHSITLTLLETPLGQKATQKEMPFYILGGAD